MDLYPGLWSFVDHGSSTASSCDVEVTQTPEAGNDITRSRRLDWLDFSDPPAHSQSQMSMDPSAFLGMIGYEQSYQVSPALVNNGSNIYPQAMPYPAITPSSPFLPHEMGLVGQPLYSQQGSLVPPAAEFQPAFAATQAWSPGQSVGKHAVHSRIGVPACLGIHAAPNSGLHVTSGRLPMATYGEEGWGLQHNNCTHQSRGNWASGHGTELTLGVRLDNDLDEAESGEPCYAQLLFQCLKEAPDNTLSLREIYDWVSEHSQKAKDPKNRGWQNSVRHNLSMNAAFQRVTHQVDSTTKPKGSLWQLTEQALQDGVISTTRYRKDPKRKTERRAVPAPSRQRSGAKGGQATRDATRRREAMQQQQQQEQQEQHHPHNTLRSSHGAATPSDQQPIQRHPRRSERRHQGLYQPYPSAPTTHPHFHRSILSPTPTSPYFSNPADGSSSYNPGTTPQPSLCAHNRLRQTQQIAPAVPSQQPTPARSPAAPQQLPPDNRSSDTNFNRSDDFLEPLLSLDPRILTAAPPFTPPFAAAFAPPPQASFSSSAAPGVAPRDAKPAPGLAGEMDAAAAAALHASAAFGIDPAAIFAAPPPPPALPFPRAPSSSLTPSLTATEASFFADDAVPGLLLPGGSSRGESPLGLM